MRKIYNDNNGDDDYVDNDGDDDDDNDVDGHLTFYHHAIAQRTHNSIPLTWERNKQTNR